jgi:hypothetical protein
MMEYPPGVRLFVGGTGGSAGGLPIRLDGDRCWTAAGGLPPHPADQAAVRCLLDSGAFSDPPAGRLTPAGALDRQLAWEHRAAARWGTPWRAEAIVSYDLLIDEVWTDGARAKRRWAVAEAERAVDATVEAAAYLADRRAELAPRTIVLSAQGVDAEQYAGCVDRVLQVARPGDWLGLGGWCILGRQTSWLPEFGRTLELTIPRIAAAGLSHVHVFGVLWGPALGGLLWHADRAGLTVSTDSTKPIRDCTCEDGKRAGRRAEGWPANVAWWRAFCAGLRSSPFYRRPRARSGRQATFTFSD